MKKGDKRICLKCQEVFISAGNWNRLCGGCQTDNQRKSIPSKYIGAMVDRSRGGIDVDSGDKDY